MCLFSSRSVSTLSGRRSPTLHQKFYDQNELIQKNIQTRIKNVAREHSLCSRASFCLLCNFNKKETSSSSSPQDIFYHRSAPLSRVFLQFDTKGLIFYSLYIFNNFRCKISKKLFTNHKKCATIKMRTGSTNPAR